MLATLHERHQAEWTRVEHLLASIADACAVIAHNSLIGPHADPKKLRSIKPPKPIPRPGEPKKKRKPTGAELREVLSPFMGG